MAFIYHSAVGQCSLESYIKGICNAKYPKEMDKHEMKDQKETQADDPIIT
jgi:hypothetical protein